MTSSAALCLLDLVNNLLLEVLLLVTLEANLVPFTLQQSACLRGVGGMTGNAFASAKGRMDVLFTETYLFFTMARITDFIPFLLQNQFTNQSMAEVTILTLLLLHHRMNILHPHVFVQ